MRTLLATVATPPTPRVPVLLVFWKKAPAPVLERIPELERNEVAPPVKRALLALLKTPALLRYPAAAVIVRLLVKVAACATPRVPVLLVFWKNAAACVLLRIPELERNEVAPPVSRTLDALLKMPALLMKAPGAVWRILLAMVVMPATPRVVVLLVDWKKDAAPTLLKMPELERIAVAPPVKKTLEALLKTPALDKKPAVAVMVRLLARVAAPATPRVVVLLVLWKKAAAPTFDRMPELER